MIDIQCTIFVIVGLAAFICAFAGVARLITSKRPTEQRPTVAWMVVNGLWDRLAKEGLPAAEIERLKRLTPGERAELMASFSVPIQARRRPKWEPCDDADFYYGDANQYRL